jgi:hypothetical protein
MKRLFPLLALCLAIVPMSAGAQQYARRDVPHGDVTGLEMTIEGALSAPRGGELSWFVTVYEVLHRRDLRPAAGVALRVTASFSEGPPVFETQTDADGRAVLTVAIPADLESSASLVVEAVSPRGIRRTFDADIEIAPSTRVQLFVDRDVAPPSGSVMAFGRVLDARTGRVASDTEVTVGVRNPQGASLSGVRSLVTDARGVFSAELPLPARTMDVVIVASTEDGSASHDVAVVVPVTTPLWVRATPARSVVAPGETVSVDVEIRDDAGVLVPGARIDWSDAPVPDDEEPIRTDASGHAQLSWEIDRLAVPSGEWAARGREIRVVHPAHGSATGSAIVRVAPPGAFVTWAVEGGALATGLPSRVFVRVVHADGTPDVGRALHLSGERFAAPSDATTDAEGVAVLSVTPRATSSLTDGATEGCVGPTAVAAQLDLAGADATQEALCLPLDPDAALAVHAHVTESGALDVSIDRRSDVAGRPVVVTALVSRDEAWVPIARAMISGSARTASLPLATARGEEVWLRARPVIAQGQEVRGGSTLVWSAGAAPAWSGAFEATETGGTLRSIDGASTSGSFAIDPENGARLEQSFAAAMGPLGAAIAVGHGAAYVDAIAATNVPSDDSAPAVLREGNVEPLPLPDAAVALGLLRDPWRTRARFVRGRLGSLMRAVETYVDAHVSSSLEDVAVVERGGHRFNHEVLEAALEESGLGDERAAALDGEPLDIDALTTLDPAFTFDHVAQRITRARLFRLLGFLRDLVRAHELDLPWARRGDPSAYPLSLLEADDVAWRGDALPERAHLFDAWGNPFVLVPVHGAARFSFLQPVSGYELTSPGADGRIGTRDDVLDPFARVLPSGGVYAEAVGEDELVARLSSVELGRATLETLGNVFDIYPVVLDDGAETAPTDSWDTAPTVLLPSTLAPAPVPLLARTLGSLRDGSSSAVSWSLPRERRHYIAIGFVFSESGALAWRERRFEAGAPVAARFDPPDVMRPGETLRVPIGVTRLADGPTPTIRATSSSSAIEVRVDGTDLVIEAAREGLADVELRLESAGAPTWTASHHVRVVPDGALFAAYDGAIASPEASLTLPLRDGARAWRGHVVIGAPRSLRRDPIFSDADDRSHDAIDGWADVLAGEEPEADDVAALQRAVVEGTSPVDLACALVVFAARSDLAAHLDTRAASTLADRLPDDLGVRASMLVALAPAAGMPLPSSGASDRVSSVIASLRQDGWRALATERDRPSMMARIAAGLLLADRSDSIGRALYERARARATEAEGFGPEIEDAYVGTLALALAARQAGDDAFADGLGQAIVRRVHLAPRLGHDAVFWAYAASAYGALGAGAPEHVTVEIDGQAQDVTLTGGAVDLVARPGASVRVRADAPVWMRIESRTVMPIATRDDVALAPRIDGVPGRAGERAALELTLESTSDDEIAAPIVEITLPSSAAFDDETRAAVLASSAVESIEGPDRAGVVRLHLHGLRGRASHRVPLPVRFRAPGETRGFGLVVYDRERPWARTTRPATGVEVEAP